ncbi:MAG TPA: hypothetical protein VG897_09255 [Terriglobales bacterium]|nr:hypothetical protein [Terriglobales bacterium]
MREFKHKCELRLLVCEPNPLRPDRVTVGFVLCDTDADNPRVEVGITSNLRPIQCVYPDADIEAIQASLQELEPILKNVTDFDQYLQNMPAEGSAEFSFLPVTALLTDSIEKELELLETQYLTLGTAPPDTEKAPAEYGRAYILRKMQEAFRYFGVWQYLEKQVPLDDFTFKGDPLKIDFGYLNRGTNTYRLLHAVSLVTDLDRAKILALSWPFIREGINKSRGHTCELVAVTEDPSPLMVAERAAAARQWMQEVGVIVEPMSASMRLAGGTRVALGL